MTDSMLWCDSYICKSVRMQVWEEAKFTAESFPAPYSCLPEDRVSSLGPLPATPGFPRGSRSFPAGVFQKERSPQRASHIYFILLAWAIVLVQVWFNLWILQLLPIPVAGNTHTHSHSQTWNAAHSHNCDGGWFLFQCGYWRRWWSTLVWRASPSGPSPPGGRCWRSSGVNEKRRCCLDQSKAWLSSCCVSTPR